LGLKGTPRDGGKSSQKGGFFGLHRVALQEKENKRFKKGLRAPVEKRGEVDDRILRKRTWEGELKYPKGSRGKGFLGG